MPAKPAAASAANIARVNHRNCAKIEPCVKSAPVSYMRMRGASRCVRRGQERHSLQRCNDTRVDALLTWTRGMKWKDQLGWYPQNGLANLAIGANNIKLV